VGSSPSGTESPRSGLTIVPQAPYDVPRIYGATRADAMCGAGFVTAEDRLFFMDVLRHTAEGTTAELLGPSAASADSTQLGLQDASPQQLTDQMDSLPKTMGAEGAQTLNDIEQYVAGINAFINLTQIDPARLPAEYPALGITPKSWTLADSAAVGTGERLGFGRLSSHRGFPPAVLGAATGHPWAGPPPPRVKRRPR
jgi:acyl-homoserine lactone acylase PvdQ